MDRYGSVKGEYLGNVGDKISKRSLAIHSRSSDKYTYELLKDTQCTTGKVAPWFGEPGGGIQYIFEYIDPISGETKLRTIEQMLEKGYLREIK